MLFRSAPDSNRTPPLRTLTSLNKEAGPFSLCDNSIWHLPSVSSLSDCSIWRSDQRSKKLDPRSKFSISIEIFDLARKFQSRRLDFPTKTRAAVGGSLEIFNLDRNFQSRSKSRIFLIFGPSGIASDAKKFFFLFFASDAKTQ